MESCDDTQAVTVLLASECEHSERELTPSDQTAATCQTDASESICMTEQNGGHCIQLVDGVDKLADDASEDRLVNECTGSAVADEDETLAAAATNANDELPDSGLVAADSGGGVQVPVDEIANDAAVYNADVPDEAPVAEELNEPQQQAAAEAADAELVEPVGNIIPPPLVVLAPQGLGDVHQAMMQGGGPVGFQPYKHPNLFALRVTVSVYLMNLTMKIINDITVHRMK